MSSEKIEKCLYAWDKEGRENGDSSNWWLRIDQKTIDNYGNTKTGRASRSNMKSSMKSTMKKLSVMKQSVMKNSGMKISAKKSVMKANVKGQSKNLMSAAGKKKRDGQVVEKSEIKDKETINQLETVPTSSSSAAVEAGISPGRLFDAEGDSKQNNEQNSNIQIVDSFNWRKHAENTIKLQREALSDYEEEKYKLFVVD